MEQRSSYQTKPIEIHATKTPMQHQLAGHSRASSQLTWALIASNLFLGFIVTGNTFGLMGPYSLPSYLPLSHEKLGSKMETRPMILSCTEMPQHGSGSDLFGKTMPAIPVIYHTASKNTGADITETTDDGTKGSGSKYVAEITSKITTEYTAVKTTNEVAPSETTKRTSPAKPTRISPPAKPTSTSLSEKPTSISTPTKSTNKSEIMTTATIITSESVKENDQETFQDWLKHNSSKLAEEMLSKLGTEKNNMKIEEAKEVAASLTPPPPPLDTVLGYNPWLDKPRPTTIEDYLRHFEVLFVVDDSGSMNGTRWTETRDALATIARKANELKVDTVGIRFLNDPTDVRGLRGKKKLISLFDKVQPRGATPLGRTLKKVFGEHLNRIETAVRRGGGGYSKILPLDIIVLTDGVPTDKGEDKPPKVVANAVKRLSDSHYHPNTMGVQIVQIAKEERAKHVLKDLVLGDNGRIVDTVPYTSIVDSERLLRILLGGVHPNIRSQLPAVMLAT